MSQHHLNYLEQLESESIHIFREVAAQFEKPALLFSGGKDSITMVHLTAELGEFIGTDIEPTALYKYHTIEAITGFVYDLSKSSANES